jgi:serine/threonine protein kinase
VAATRSDGLVYRPRVTERPEQRPHADRLIADRYRLGEIIGRGGMATIYRAHDTRTDRVVALKLLRPEISADRDLADRFRREALAATVLRHQNIVACVDTGSDPAGPFLVMDLIEGEDLAARLTRTGPLPPAEVARIGLDIARALGVAHVRGIVHRDVKPSNILLARDGRAMITDFGIARLAADAEAALPGTTLGSIQYFSPEQAQGLNTTAASDVYGLGLVMYEALTGRRPWGGETPGRIALARVGATAPSPRDVRADVPLALDVVVTRALAADPAARYPSGTAMASAIEPILGTIDPSSPTTIVDRSAWASAGQPVTAASAGAGRRSSGRSGRPRSTGRSDGSRTGRLIVLGIVLLIAAVLVLGALPAFGEGDGAALVSAEPAGTASPTPKATPEPTAKPTPKPTATPRPTPEPTPVPTDAPPPVAAGEVAAVCDPFFDIPCSLGAGLYAPMRFRPEVIFKLGDGWSAATNAERLVVLARDEGFMTLASDVDVPEVRDKDEGSARKVIDAIARLDGLSATKPAQVKIDDLRGRSIDIEADGRDRVEIFVAGGQVYVVERDRPTRVVAIDVGKEVLLIVIEPRGGQTLEAILETADDVAASLRDR